MESSHVNVDVKLQGLSDDYYQHEPLDHSKHSIRLVRVLPSLCPEGLIQCDIFHGTTDVTYECLSYRWGDPYPEGSILIGGKRFRVRQNLLDFLALGHLTAQFSSMTLGPLWIDALCINQNDTAERNHQVGQMGEIFSSAITVNLWLGRCVRLLNTFTTYKSHLNGAAYRCRLEPSVRQTNGQLSPFLVHLNDVYGHRSQHTYDSDSKVKRQAIEENFFNNEY